MTTTTTTAMAAAATPTARRRAGGGTPRVIASRGARRKPTTTRRMHAKAMENDSDDDDDRRRRMMMMRTATTDGKEGVDVAVSIPSVDGRRAGRERASTSAVSATPGRREAPTAASNEGYGRRRMSGGGRGEAMGVNTRGGGGGGRRRDGMDGAGTRVGDARRRGLDERTREVLLTRGLLLNKLIVTRTSGSRLGVATNLWVDTDVWEVVALDVRQNALVGNVDHVLLESLRQVGDVILVHDESAVERRWSSYGYSLVVGKDVVTESGQFIGRVRDFEFDPEDGAIARIIVDAWGVPTVPEGVVSTYAVDIAEIITCGQERIIVAEDAESRVEQLSMSVLQRLTLTAPPWEEEEMYGEEYYDYGYAEYDARRGQRRAKDEYAAYSDRRRERGAPMEARAPSSPSRRREGIPLVRPTQPYERRDVDGGYGDRPGFTDWMVRDNRERDMETVDSYWEPPVRRAAAAASRPDPSPGSAGSPRRGRPPPRRRQPQPPPSSSSASRTFDADEDML
jgi:sporulation protein YlmC with PRC-barrel domain